MNNKQKKEEVKNSVVIKCENKVSRDIQKRIDQGVYPLDAYDEMLKKFDFEEDIILFYDIEAEKADLSKDLTLYPLEIKQIEDQIRSILFNKFLKEV